MIRYVMVTAIISFLLASCGDDVGSSNAGELGVARYNEDIDPDDYLPSCLMEKSVDVVASPRPFEADLSEGPIEYRYANEMSTCRGCDVEYDDLMDWRVCSGEECSNLRSEIPGKVIEERPHSFGIRLSTLPINVSISLSDESGEVASGEVSGQGEHLIKFDKSRYPGRGPFTLTAASDDRGNVIISALSKSSIRYIKSECL